LLGSSKAQVVIGVPQKPTVIDKRERIFRPNMWLFHVAACWSRDLSHARWPDFSPDPRKKYV